MVSPKKDPLALYRHKRNVQTTPEPDGRATFRKSDQPIFVIQKHAARRLHYDLRLEINNVLASWAVPKGPSLSPHEKRLAVQTEDHPLSYATFEGVIPPDNYGAGTVMVWDIGTYDHLTTKKGKPISLSHALQDGKIEVFLRGKKIYGVFALIRTQQNWLLIKEHDEYASDRKNPVRTKQKSILSERTMTQIARDYWKDEDE